MMASESTEERSVTVRLPAELDEWLDEQSETLDIDRETLLVQLLASYREATTAVGEDGDVPIATDESIEDVVTDILADTLDERVRSAVETQVRTVVEEVVDERVSESREDVRDHVDGRIDDVEADHRAKLEDVRNRVVQLKRELDEKAPADHGHEQFERIETMANRLDEVAATVDSLDAELSELPERVDDHATAIERFDERLETAEERLRTVAWVVRDLRDAQEARSGVEALDRIKRAAAKADVERAKCEHCGNGVSIGLLADPECPHCESTVTNVEPANGFFGKPRLVTASQLESGEEHSGPEERAETRGRPDTGDN